MHLDPPLPWFIEHISGVNEKFAQNFQNFISLPSAWPHSHGWRCTRNWAMLATNKQAPLGNELNDSIVINMS